MNPEEGKFMKHFWEPTDTECHSMQCAHCIMVININDPGWDEHVDADCAEVGSEVVLVIDPQEPWRNEPDAKDWEAHGLKCAMRRNATGAWCGYVGVPVDHPHYGVDYYNLPFDVHGGLTYGAAGAIWLGEGLYWFGFDCAHWGDYCPGLPPAFRMGTYRDEAYVTSQTESLAQQMLDLPSPLRLEADRGVNGILG